VIPTDIDILP